MPKSTQQFNITSNNYKNSEYSYPLLKIRGFELRLPGNLGGLNGNKTLLYLPPRQQGLRSQKAGEYFSEHEKSPEFLKIYSAVVKCKARDIISKEQNLQSRQMVLPQTSIVTSPCNTLPSDFHSKSFWLTFYPYQFCVKPLHVIQHHFVFYFIFITLQVISSKYYYELTPAHWIAIASDYDDGVAFWSDANHKRIMKGGLHEGATASPVFDGTSSTVDGNRHFLMFNLKIVNKMADHAKGECVHRVVSTSYYYDSSKVLLQCRIVITAQQFFLVHK